MTEILIDFTGVKPYRPGGLIQVPDGDYEFVVVGTEMTESKSSRNLMVVAELEVSGPDVDAMLLRDHLMLEGGRADGRVRLQSLFRSVGLHRPSESISGIEFEAHQVVGRRGRCKLKTDTTTKSSRFPIPVKFSRVAFYLPPDVTHDRSRGSS